VHRDGVARERVDRKDVVGAIIESVAHLAFQRQPRIAYGDVDGGAAI
jgi:hypothetical protein